MRRAAIAGAVLLLVSPGPAAWSAAARIIDAKAAPGAILPALPVPALAAVPGRPLTAPSVDAPIQEAAARESARFDGVRPRRKASLAVAAAAPTALSFAIVASPRLAARTPSRLRRAGAALRAPPFWVDAGLLAGAMALQTALLGGLQAAMPHGPLAQLGTMLVSCIAATFLIHSRFKEIGIVSMLSFLCSLATSHSDPRLLFPWIPWLGPILGACAFALTQSSIHGFPAEKRVGLLPLRIWLQMDAGRPKNGRWAEGLLGTRPRRLAALREVARDPDAADYIPMLQGLAADWVDVELARLSAGLLGALARRDRRAEAALRSLAADPDPHASSPAGKEVFELLAERARRAAEVARDAAGLEKLARPRVPGTELAERARRALASLEGADLAAKMRRAAIEESLALHEAAPADTVLADRLETLLEEPSAGGGGVRAFAVSAPSRRPTAVSPDPHQIMAGPFRHPRLYLPALAGMEALAAALMSGFYWLSPHATLYAVLMVATLVSGIRFASRNHALGCTVALMAIMEGIFAAIARFCAGPWYMISAVAVGWVGTLLLGWDLESRFAPIERDAARALRAATPDPASAVVRRLLSWKQTRLAALRAVPREKTSVFVPVLAGLLRLAPDQESRLAAAEALGRLAVSGDAAALAALEEEAAWGDIAQPVQRALESGLADARSRGGLALPEVARPNADTGPLIARARAAVANLGSSLADTWRRDALIQSLVDLEAASGPEDQAVVSGRLEELLRENRDR